MAESWQELRDRRLLGEFQELKEFSNRSPLVKVEPVGNIFPPIEYVVTYNCLGYIDSSKKQTTTGHKIRIILPAHYPKTPPIFQYESKVWAPSFLESYTASEHGNRTIKHYICIGHIGTPQVSLRTFIIGVGHMIQLRRDARGLHPLDMRSLEGPDFDETASPNEMDFEIALIDSSTISHEDDVRIVIIRPEKDGKDLDGLIKIGNNL